MCSGVRSPRVCRSRTSEFRPCSTANANAPTAEAMSVDLDVALCLPRQAETVGLIRGIVTDALAKLGVAPDCVDDIGLALSEASTNVVDHAAVDDEYEVRFPLDDRRCQISVTNTGIHFEVETLDVMPRWGVHTRSRGRHHARAWTTLRFAQSRKPAPSCIS